MAQPKTKFEIGRFGIMYKIIRKKCKDLVGECQKTQPKRLDFNSILDASKSKNTKIKNYYQEMIDNWINAGYFLSSIEWYNYYPNEHYNAQFTNQFAEYVNINPKRDWVSLIMPGKTAPWHWDVDDKHEQWLQEGKLMRYSIFLGEKNLSHFLALEGKDVSACDIGTIVKWKDYRNYHSAANCGLQPFFLYHCLGVKL